jgi:hypothetical protein
MSSRAERLLLIQKADDQENAIFTEAETAREAGAENWGELMRESRRKVALLDHTAARTARESLAEECREAYEAGGKVWRNWINAEKE